MRGNYYRTYYEENREARKLAALSYYYANRATVIKKQAEYRKRPDRKYLKKVARQMQMTYPQARIWLASQGVIV